MSEGKRSCPDPICSLFSVLSLGYNIDRSPKAKLGDVSATDRPRVQALRAHSYDDWDACARVRSEAHVMLSCE